MCGGKAKEPLLLFLRRMRIISMPLPPPSPLYTDLINLLHPSPPLPQILELDILPSSYPSTLYSAPPSLALPKSLLASLFVTAHGEFFTYITSQKGVHPSIEDGGTQGRRSGDRGFAADESCESDSPRYNAALNATRVLLLWDPNHITAANFRKRYLLSRSRSKTDSIPDSQSTQYATAPPATAFLFLLRSELSFLTSLVTSPLPKAPKASTLWAHRLWLLRSFHADILVLLRQEQENEEELEADYSPSERVEESADTKSEGTAPVMKKKVLLRADPTTSHPNSILIHLYTTELQIVMRAADRHPRNYYAWGYARALFTHLITTTLSPTKNPTLLPLSLTLSVLSSTHKWCMTHPRDISGWTFLAFLIQRLGPGLGPAPSESSPTGSEPANSGYSAADIDMQSVARRELERILSATAEAAERFKWRGESVRWFLRRVGRWEGKVGGEE